MSDTEQANPNLGAMRPSGDAPVAESQEAVAEAVATDTVPSEGQSVPAPEVGTDAPVESAPVDNAGDATGAVAGSEVQS